MRKLITVLVLIVSFLSCDFNKEKNLAERWSIEKAWEWYNNYEWLMGTNFIPSTAINQLECWQEESFDTETIDRELRWSADLGMNVHRVFLHNLLWENH